MFSKICRGKKIFLFVPWAFSKKKVKTSFCLHVIFGQPLQNRLFCLRTGFPYPGRKRCAQIEFSFHHDSNSFRTKRFQIKLRLAENVYLSSAPCKTGLFCRFCTLFRRNVPLEGPRREGQHDATCWPSRRELLFCNTRPFGLDSLWNAIFRHFLSVCKNRRFDIDFR